MHASCGEEYGCCTLLTATHDYFLDVLRRMVVRNFVVKCGANCKLGTYIHTYIPGLFQPVG